MKDFKTWWKQFKLEHAEKMIFQQVCDDAQTAFDAIEPYRPAYETGWNAAIKECEAKYDTLKASHAKLKKYAQHKDDCNLMSLIPCVSVKRNGRKISCTCGLDKALAEAEKIK